MPCDLLVTHDIVHIQHFVKLQACQSSNWQSARLLLCLASQLTSFSVALVFLPFFPGAWGGPCLGQGTVTDVRNILCLYIIKKVL